MREFQRTLVGFDPTWRKVVSKIEAERYAKLIRRVHFRVVKSTKEPREVRQGVSLVLGATKILSAIKKFNDPYLHAATIYNEIARHHYFIEGNKRTAHCLAKAHLFLAGIHFKFPYKYAVTFVQDIAAGNKTKNQVILWIKKKSVRYQERSTKKYLNSIIKEMNVVEKRGRPRKHDEKRIT